MNLAMFSFASSRAFLAASLMFFGVSKSGSPISRWTMLRPCASSCRARARTSKAVEGKTGIKGDINTYYAGAASGGATNPAGRLHGHFTAVAHQPNGRILMQFSAQPRTIYIIEASTNLVTWEVIGVARDAGQNLFDFEDVHVAQFPGRFYRVASP